MQDEMAVRKCLEYDKGLQSFSSGVSKLPNLTVQRRMTCERMDPIRKTSGFAYGPLINPRLSFRKLSYKYNCMLTYIPVSFLFSFKRRVGVVLK